jgi:hypothetical protein
MGCPSEVWLGQNFVFTIDVHDPTTGGESDADAAPTYRIYEDVADTPILTGTMDKLDDGNTVGFYAKQIAGTEANGFGLNKCYTVKARALVDTVAGNISFTFYVRDIYSVRVRAGVSEVTSQLSGDDVYIHRGDTMVVAFTGVGDISNRDKLWFCVKRNKKSNTDAESIILIEETDGLVYLNGQDASARSTNGSITVTDEVAGDGYVTMKPAETDDLVPRTGMYYDLQELDTSGVVTTLRSGEAAVTADVTRAVS